MDRWPTIADALRLRAYGHKSAASDDLASARISKSIWSGFLQAVFQTEPCMREAAPCTAAAATGIRQGCRIVSHQAQTDRQDSAVTDGLHASAPSSLAWRFAGRRTRPQAISPVADATRIRTCWNRRSSSRPSVGRHAVTVRALLVRVSAVADQPSACCSRGKASVKRAPRPGADVTSINPPACRTALYTCARPRPAPLSAPLVVK